MQDFVNVFLAGPIKGGESWREKVIATIMNNFNQYPISEITPKKSVFHFDESQMSGNQMKLNIFNPQSIEKKEDFTNERHQYQIEWETEHLASSDVIVLYIPAQERDTKNYGKTTRFEFGEYFGIVTTMVQVILSLTKSPVGKNLLPLLEKVPRLVIYIDDEFDGKYYIEKRISYVLEVSPSLTPYLNVCQTDDDFNTTLTRIITSKFLTYSSNT